MTTRKHLLSAIRFMASEIERRRMMLPPDMLRMVRVSGCGKYSAAVVVGYDSDFGPFAYLAEIGPGRRPPSYPSDWWVPTVRGQHTSPPLLRVRPESGPCSAHSPETACRVLEDLVGSGRFDAWLEDVGGAPVEMFEFEYLNKGRPEDQPAA